MTNLTATQIDQQPRTAVQGVKKSRRKWPGIVGGAVVLLFVIAIANGGNTAKSATIPGGSSALTNQIAGSAPSAPAVPSGPLTSFGDGTYAVGTDILAGTYHTIGQNNTNPLGCYWERDTDTSGNTSSIIANNIGKGPTTVTISASDGAFKTSGCNTWTKVQ
jgi:hypothetical protein